MDFALLVTGIAIGLSVTAPLGPVNIIVIRNALRRNFVVALLTGLGAVAAIRLLDGTRPATVDHDDRSIRIGDHALDPHRIDHTGPDRVLQRPAWDHVRLHGDRHGGLHRLRLVRILRPVQRTSMEQSVFQ